MRCVFLGDLVGRAGRVAAVDRLPGLIERYAIDFVVVNAENSAGGFGITEEIFHDLLDAGADVVTLGNHAFDQKEALVFIERQNRLVRPANYPAGTPGRGAALHTARNGAQVLVVQIMGRLFMDPLDDPFQVLDRELGSCRLGDHADAIIVDVHAEATSEKQAIGHYLDGRVSLVVGTHTHIPTADHQILSGGTGYLSDAGMCGDYDSVIGMQKEEPLQRFTRKVASARFTPALGEPTLCGVAVETDDVSGLATQIAPLRLGGRLSETVPATWQAD
ncbi:MAG: TIGR00282 family metallophosphoesterase [Pseudomonadota bacterium]